LRPRQRGVGPCQLQSWPVGEGRLDRGLPGYDRRGFLRGSPLW
jgi:hypothetical protein